MLPDKHPLFMLILWMNLNEWKACEYKHNKAVVDEFGVIMFNVPDNFCSSI